MVAVTLDLAAAKRVLGFLERRITSGAATVAILGRVDAAALWLGFSSTLALLVVHGGRAPTPWLPLTCVLFFGASSLAAWLMRRRAACRLTAREHAAQWLAASVDSLRRADGPKTIVVPTEMLLAIGTLIAEPRLGRVPGNVANSRSGALPWIPGAAVFGVTMAALVVLWYQRDDAPAGARSWLFLDEAEFVGTRGFEPTEARAGVWRVEPHETAIGRSALVNLPGEAEAPPATAIANAFAASDVLVRTRCKVAPSDALPACGVVFRWDSARRHWIARVDTTAGVVSVGIVEDGVERLVDSAPILAEASLWQDLVVTARGDRIVVEHNGTTRVEIRDAITHPGDGVGLWAPAASTAYFDEFTAHPLADRADLLEVVL
jgi:hypothetical protein